MNKAAKPLRFGENCERGAVCHFCNANKGEVCRDENGRPMKNGPHPVRWETFRRAVKRLKAIAAKHQAHADRFEREGVAA